MGDTLQCVNSAASHNKVCKERSMSECTNVDTQYVAVTQNLSEYALNQTEEWPWLMGWMPPLRIHTVWIQGQTTCSSFKYEPVSFYGCLSCLHCYWQWLFKNHELRGDAPFKHILPAVQNTKYTEGVGTKKRKVWSGMIYVVARHRCFNIYMQIYTLLNVNYKTSRVLRRNYL